MSLSVTIDASKLSCSEYILPLHLCNLSNKHFETDTQNDIVLLGVKYVLKKLDVKVNQLSTNSVEDGDGTGLSGLIDGDLEGSGYFHSKWSASGSRCSLRKLHRFKYWQNAPQPIFRLLDT